MNQCLLLFPLCTLILLWACFQAASFSSPRRQCPIGFFTLISNHLLPSESQQDSKAFPWYCLNALLFLLPSCLSHCIFKTQIFTCVNRCNSGNVLMIALGPGWKRILLGSCCCSGNSTFPGAGTQGSALLNCQHVPETGKQSRETPRNKLGFSTSQSLLPAGNLGGASQVWRLGEFGRMDVARLCQLASRQEKRP